MAWTEVSRLCLPLHHVEGFVQLYIWEPLTLKAGAIHGEAESTHTRQVCSSGHVKT